MKKIHQMAVLLLCFGFSSTVSTSKDAVEAEPPDKAKWTAIHQGVEVEEKKKDGTIEKKPGGVTGVYVERNSGDLYVHVFNSGLWKSADQGKTFTLSFSNNQGACCSVSSLRMDPDDGKRMLCFLSGGPSALTLDGGKTWTPINQTGDHISVDWSDIEAKTLLANRGGHDALFLSRDQGRTWKQNNPGWPWMSMVFDATTYLVGGNCGGAGLLKRTEDGGATWTEVTERFDPCSRVTYMFKGAGYCLAKEGLMITKDKGKTWTKQPLPKGQFYCGPFFGKDEKHMVAAAVDNGFFESKDGGKTWQPVVNWPVKPRNHHINMICAWDYLHDTFYFCISRGPAYKCQR